MKNQIFKKLSRFLGAGIVAACTFCGSANAVENDNLQNLALQNDLGDLQIQNSTYSFEFVTIIIPKTLLGLGEGTISVIHVRYDESVFFDYDKFDLTQGSLSAIIDLANVLKNDAPDRSVVIVGHTDAVGSQEYNSSLSKKRADTVAQKLVSLGLNASQLNSIPMGESQPISTNKDDAGRARNRRVEFFISNNRAASFAAVERIPFGPCFRNDQENTDSERQAGENCENAVVEIPVFGAGPNSNKVERKVLVSSKKPVKGFNIIPSRPLLPHTPRTRPLFGNRKYRL